MRVFIAIDLPKNMKERIAELMNEFDKTCADISFINPENLHVTLKFLGEVNEDEVKSIVKIVSESLKETQAYNISVSGLGFFGKPGFIRVLWLNVDGGRSRTIQIMRNLNNRLEHIRREGYRNPSPHLTIGRVRNCKNSERLREEIGRFSDVKMGEIYVNTIRLKRSVLIPKGPVYTDLELFHLVE